MIAILQNCIRQAKQKEAVPIMGQLDIYEYFPFYYFSDFMKMSVCSVAFYLSFLFFIFE